MAAHIAYHLRGFQRPRLLAVVHTAIIHIRVTDASHYTGLHALFLTGKTGKKRAFMVVAERTAQRVAQVIAKRRHSGHLLHVGLHSQLVVCYGTTSGTPAFSVYHHILRQGLAYLVHRGYVMYSHQIHAKSVDVILIHPVEHTLQHIATKL